MNLISEITDTFWLCGSMYKNIHNVMHTLENKETQGNRRIFLETLT